MAPVQQSDSATYFITDKKPQLVCISARSIADLDRATSEYAQLRKVTFFWPFYGKYWILDLGQNYEYAVVGEPGRDYLWILSRTQQMDEALYRQLLAKMQARGFDTTRMIKTAHPAIGATIIGESGVLS